MNKKYQNTFLVIGLGVIVLLLITAMEYHNIYVKLHDIHNTIKNSKTTTNNVWEDSPAIDNMIKKDRNENTEDTPDRFQVFTITVAVTTSKPESFKFIKDKFKFLASSSSNLDNNITDIELIKIAGIYESKGSTKKVDFGK